MMQTLNHQTVELSGTTLIEASAGTGKTYAIAALYLRLLLERELDPSRILVVTYTEAATKELRARIRSRIREALNVLGGTGSDDPLLLALYESASATGMTREREILERALGAFDTASIFTIHGFCLRALQDNAFESGSLYDTELATDQQKLLQEIVDDFWRIHFFRAPSPMLAFALQNTSPQKLMELLRGLHSGTGSRVIPEFTEREIELLEEANCERYGALVQEWRDEKQGIVELLRSDKALSRSAEFYRADLLEPLVERMDCFVAGGNHNDLFPGFVKFTRSGIAEGTKPKSHPPAHPFFESCEALLQGVQERFLALQAELLLFCREQMPLRKAAANLRYFDDLLLDLYHALLSPGGGEGFAATLRQKYQAALIDEFQDTDPVQYEIFRKIYSASHLPLFLIGDPKQAIYSFRGADIFAYLRAARDVDETQRFTLTVNWRSVPALLGAFNTLFEQTKNPFLYDAILYHPLTAGRSVEEGGLKVAGEMEATASPFQLWMMEPEEGADGTLSIGAATTFAAAAVAREIDRLLQEGGEGRAMIEGRALGASDLAVIVRTHRQARIVLDALQKRGIAAVMQSERSVLCSPEAEELRLLLAALGDPSSERKVRAALATDLLGRSGNDIVGLLEDDEASVELLRQFRSYHHLWLERGFMVMSRELLSKEGIRGRLLAFPDGQRRLTNLLHCFELLHQRAHERRLGMEGVISWFTEELAGADTEGDEYQIRLETDEAAVKIVTVHVSKGLEYPVVFCPFFWSGTGRSGERVVTFHNEEGEMIRDFGSADLQAHRHLAERESMAESLRVLYVALTRARYRSCVLTGNIVDRTKKSSPEHSPLNMLLFGTTAGQLGGPQMQQALQALADGSDGSIGFRRLREGEGESEGESEGKQAASLSWSLRRAEESAPVLRLFKGKIQGDWRVSSFTSFSRHELKPAELPDRDDFFSSFNLPALPVVAAPEKSIFAFPRGAEAGIFMHALFETLDFADPSGSKIPELVQEQLLRYGYDPEWEPAVTAMVHHVLDTPIAEPKGFFTLGSLKSGKWITELEFFLPLRFLTPSLLAAILRRHGSTEVGGTLEALAAALNFKPVRGMMMGFMDMVFEHDGRYYLLDWKSNHLGNTIDDYRFSYLREAMESNLYTLQYLLYTVALNRYLEQRVEGYSYESHFGGVLYVFLRGVNAAEGEGAGFFRERPSWELIEALSRLFESGEEELP